MTGGVAGAATVYSFRLNSIYDPNFTGVGHQPSTHDQFNVLYESYCVTGCRYKISAINSSNTDPAYIAIQCIDSANSNTVFSSVVEQGGVEWKPLGGINGSPGAVTFEGYASNLKLVGKDYDQYTGNSQYVTLFGANPGDVTYLNIYTTNAGTGDGPSIYLCVELIYDVLLQGSNVITAS